MRVGCSILLVAATERLWKPLWASGTGPLRVVIDAYGTDVQLRVVASGRGLGLVPRSVLKAGTVRDELSVVEVTRLFPFI
jgi:DNA-binding transcriptional LysR family regulator